MRCAIGLILLIITTFGFGSCLTGDINDDGRVDNLDVAIVFQQWGMECMANNYLTFDGSTGYVTVPDDAVLNFGAGNFSIGGWFKTSSSDLQWIYYKKSGARGVEIYITVAGILTLRAIDTTVYACTSNISVNDNEWHHFFFSVTRDTGAILYCDGINSTASSGVFPSLKTFDASIDLLICKNDVYYFSGSLDDIRIYKGIALSQAQINTIYNNGNGKKYDIADAGAGLAFNFDEGTGNPVSTGTAELTGTITGGVTWQRGGVPFNIATKTSYLLSRKREIWQLQHH